MDKSCQFLWLLSQYDATLRIKPHQQACKMGPAPRGHSSCQVPARRRQSAPAPIVYDEAAPAKLTGIYQQTGGVYSYPINVVSSDGPLRVTLAWSDYPGTPGAAGGLVNDLDLVVIDPDGSPIYPTNASQRGASEHLVYDDGTYSSTVYRWTTYNRGMAVRFTPATFPVEVKSVQYFLIVPSKPYFKVRLLDDDGPGGIPGSLLFEKGVSPPGHGMFTVDVEGVTITEGDFYVELHYVGGSSENPYTFIDITSPAGRSYVFDGTSWCVLPCAGAPSGNWAFQAVVSTPGEATQADRVNNLVGVDVLSPAVGMYTVRVLGHNVPQGPRPYALVVSGPIEAGRRFIYFPLVLRGD